MRQVGSRGKQSVAARSEKKMQDERDAQMADLKKYAKASSGKSAAANAKMRQADRDKQEAELREDANKIARKRQKQGLKNEKMKSISGRFHEALKRK